ncbi:MAG: hypothetical protein K8S18_00190, partial [Desulfobacula sp.]|nr:hypothetical protein [Desulfobacula sp.]
EFLMGIYYDNLIFTKFLTDAWEQGNNFEEVIPVFEKNFIRQDVINRPAVENSLNSLRSFDESLDKKQRQFFGLFEIGVLHHSQDLQLASEVLEFPVPFFMDIEFLEALFVSKYSFLYRDNKTINLFKRYKLFEFNLNIQHILYPDLDTMPFAKQGNYNTKEFLVGSYYWTFLKSLRYFTEKKKYPATFAYSEKYKKFIMKWLNEIVADKNSVIHSIYDVQLAINKLTNSVNLTAENQWHSYSNIVMQYLQFKKYLK